MELLCLLGDLSFALGVPIAYFAKFKKFCNFTKLEALLSYATVNVYTMTQIQHYSLIPSFHSPLALIGHYGHLCQTIHRKHKQVIYHEILYTNPLVSNFCTCYPPSLFSKLYCRNCQAMSLWIAVYKLRLLQK